MCQAWNRRLDIFCPTNVSTDWNVHPTAGQSTGFLDPSTQRTACSGHKGRQKCGSQDIRFFATLRSPTYSPGSFRGNWHPAKQDDYYLTKLRVIPSDRRMFSTPAEKDPPPCGIQDSSRLPELRSMSGMVGRSCVCSHPWHA